MALRGEPGMWLCECETQHGDKRCGHIWLSRQQDPPEWCARCKSPRWRDGLDGRKKADKAKGKVRFEDIQ